MIAKEERIQITDLTTYPLMISKRFFTKFRPSVTAIAVYMALNLLEDDGPKMAKLVDLSDSAFEEGIAELVKKGVVRVHSQAQKTAAGKRLPPSNVYELLDI